VAKRELIIVAGPNGSGKTTFAKSFLSEKKFKFLNADEIAREAGGSKPTNAITAGKEYFKRLNKLLDKKSDLVIESTLSGLFMQKLIERFRKEKYSISIVYVILDSPQVCIERIKERVKKGGHAIPDRDVIRRFERSRINFWTVYKLKVDKWILWNNSHDAFKEVAIGEKNNFQVINQLLFEKFITDIK